MIHSSRQIKTRADAYGGYGTESERLVESAPSRIVSETPAAPVSGDSIVLRDTREQQRPVDTSMYSTRETLGESAAPQAQEQDLPARPEPEKKQRTREDLMPTIKTLKYNGENQAAPEESIAPKRKTGAIDPKYKVMLTIYVTIALVLAIAVIVTGVYISGAQADAAAVSDMLGQKQATILEQEATLASLLDEENIMEQATANGMVRADGADYSIDRVEKVDVPETPPLTNGFDKFCDGFGKFVM